MGAVFFTPCRTYAQGTQLYRSEEGWGTRYAPSLFQVEEEEEKVTFVYSGPCAGRCAVSIQVLGAMDPQQALFEQTQDWGDTDVVKIEGYLTGTRDKWCFNRILSVAEEGLQRMATAAEYNGGVLFLEVESHTGGNAQEDMAMSDALSSVIDGMVFESFGPQLQFAEVPGTYLLQEDVQESGKESEKESGKKDKKKETREKEPAQLILKEDHTGVLLLPEEVKLHWGSRTLTTDSGYSSYPYSLKGKKLTVEAEGKKLVFKRVTEETEETTEEAVTEKSGEEETKEPEKAKKKSKKEKKSE